MNVDQGMFTTNIKTIGAQKTSLSILECKVHILNDSSEFTEHLTSLLPPIQRVSSHLPINQKIAFEHTPFR